MIWFLSSKWSEWEKKGKTMYDYVKDKEFIGKMRGLCGDIMQDLCHCLKEEYDIGAIFYLVGSGARNLITQNANEAVDLDYNLELVRCCLSDGREIKETIRKAFNKVLSLNGWADCDDSTSALTTEKRHFKEGNHTEFSMDVTIVKKDADGRINRLIHEKTGWTTIDRYYWVISRDSRDIREKALEIKDAGLWELVRKEYLDNKNRYLVYNDYNHSSFVCYIEAVNNVYTRNFRY